MIAALVAAALVGLGQILGWRGVDVAASVFRVDRFRQVGFSVWDFQWYGGHWTFDYSVIYPALASVAGVVGLAVISAGVATLAFGRLVGPHFGTGGRIATYVFATGTLVQSSIGQLPFLSGEAFGLAAYWAAMRNRRVLAVLLAAAASLSSPLAGGFVAMGALAWVLGKWQSDGRGQRLIMGALLAGAAGAPVLAASVLFPGQGPMPYPFIDYVFEMGVATAFWLVARWKDEKIVAAGAVVFMGVATIAEVIPSSLGGNVGRIQDVLALPVAVALLWSGWRLAVPVLALPLVLSQWGPAMDAITTGPSQPSTHQAFFSPLDHELTRLSAEGPKGRVEVVPTAYHWEAAYVAPVMPLARGWERQLDVADNPLFYTKQVLTPTSYRAWLINNGVRFVAWPDAPLDSAAKQEGALVVSGRVAGLKLIWSSPTWQLFQVMGSSGIVTSPAELVSTAGTRVVVDSPRAATVVIRVHNSSHWVLDGAGCIVPADLTGQLDDKWITVKVPGPEQFSLDLSFLGRDDDCSAAAANQVASGRPGATPSG